MEVLQAVAATVLLSCCLFALSGVEGQTILRSQSSGVVNVEDVYVPVGANLTNVFCYTDDGTVGFGITDSTSGMFQGVPFFNASDPPPPRVFFQKTLASAPGFMFGYELNAHDYVGPQHIVGCTNDIVQARIVVGSRIGSIAHATSDDSIQGLAPGNYTFNESDTFLLIVCRAASGDPSDGSIHLNGTLFNGSLAVSQNPATASQIIYYVPSRGGSSGVYTCTGFNQFNTRADTVRRVFRITIQYRPDFAGTVKRRIVHLGDRLVLSCRVSAFPELTDLYVLYPNGTRTDSLVTDLSAGTSREVRKVIFLNMLATGSHTGNYSCNGDNLVGVSSQQIEVIVIVPPSAPRHLTVVSNSSSTIELNFAQPALDGGSPVVDYTVNCTRDVGLPHFISATTTGLSVIITNVYSGENYTCSVRARNVFSFGPAASVTVMLLKGAPCTPSVTQNNTVLGLHLNIFIPCDGGDDLMCAINRVQGGAAAFTFPRCEAGRPITYTDALIGGDTYVYILEVRNAFGLVTVETGMLSAVTHVPTLHCSTIPGIVNGRVSSDNVSLGLYITYRCNAGYRLIGAETARCVSPCNPTACSLSVPPPTCMVSHCSTLPGIVNGRVSSDTVSLGLNITYSCNAGYGLFGAVTAQCLPPCNPTTCSLSVPPPTCMGQSHISAATLGSSIVGSIIFGVIANLICLAIIRYARSLRVGQKSTASKTAQYRATTTTLTKNEAYGMAVYEATDPEHTYDCIPQNSWQV